jgi:hypothetical protein
MNCICEIKRYEEAIKLLACASYGKEVIFKDDEKGEWYNRDVCKNQTTDEMLDWFKNRIGRYLWDDDGRNNSLPC